MRRHALGIIATLFLTCGLVGLWVTEPGDGQYRMLVSVCMRAGLTLGAIWLAFPQVMELLARYPAWMIGMACLAVALVVWRPRLMGPAIAALVALHVIGLVMKSLKSPPRRHPRKPPN